MYFGLVDGSPGRLPLPINSPGKQLLTCRISLQVRPCEHRFASSIKAAAEFKEAADLWHGAVVSNCLGVLADAAMVGDRDSEYA